MAAVDEFDLAEASDDGGAPPMARPGRPRRSRPWPWVLAALALVGVGAVNVEPTPIVLGLGDGSEMGLLDLDITTAPTVVWETESSFPQVTRAEGSRAVVVEDDGTERSVLGLDLGTGDEVWRYHDEANTCGWDQPVVCVEDAGTATAAIVTIAEVDGTRQIRPHPRAVAAATAGEDLVVVEATGDATEEVVRIEPDGTERWRVAIDAADTNADPIWAGVTVIDDTVHLNYSGKQLDLATGAESPRTRFAVADGVEVDLGDGGGPVYISTDGSFVMAENESWLPYDDDLGGPIVLQQLEPNLIVAERRVDGTELWRFDSQDCWLTARLRGTAVIQCWDLSSDHVLAIDLLTGETRWELRDATVAGATADTLLIAERAEGTVLAVDPVSGSTLWSLPNPDIAYAQITELSDGVILATDTELIRLQWD